ncbi:hypothetical protein [Streptomyces hebeiensis]
MLARYRARLRHRRLMVAAAHLVRSATRETGQPHPADLIALAFGRRLTLDAAEAQRYLDAVRAERGHRITHEEGTR